MFLRRLRGVARAALDAAEVERPAARAERTERGGALEYRPAGTPLVHDTAEHEADDQHPADDEHWDPPAGARVVCATGIAG